MYAKRRLFWFAATGALLLTGACTLILDRDKTQCSSNGDCAHFSAAAVCVENVCQLGESADANIDQSAPDANVGDGASDAGDAGFSNPSCFAGTPTTNDEFANACTHAECHVFDNCAHLGVCDGGLPGVNPPTGTTPPSPPGPDAGEAIPRCVDVAASAGVQPVYLTGSSNFPPFLVTYAPVLKTQGYGVVWQVSNSCAGVDAIYNDVALGQIYPTPKQQIKESAGKQTLFYDPTTGATTNCTLDGPTNVDVGESDIYASTCTSNIGYDPSTVTTGQVGEYFGPILPMVFIVPGASSQTIFSAEAGQAVFGSGSAPAAAAPLPYTDPTQLFIRSPATATNQIISKGIFVDPKKWWGFDKGTATNMAAQMAIVAQSDAEKTIGIISADYADENAGNLKRLAFQARNQTCAFYPDSTVSSVDKRNVRDGHYSLWGPIHFFAKVTGGVPNSNAAAAFVRGFSQPKLEQDLLLSIVKSHVIPSCAMNVTRTTEMGPIKAYDPPVHCGCFFDANATGVTPSTCAACTTSADCKDPAKPTCNYGFCETH